MGTECFDIDSELVNNLIAVVEQGVDLANQKQSLDQLVQALEDSRTVLEQAAILAATGGIGEGAAAGEAAAENTLVQSGDRQALNSLIKEATNNGTTPLSVEDANTVLDWAEEQGIPGVRAGEGDVNVPSNWNANPDQPHIHIPGTGLGGHIPVEPGVAPR